jgi:glycosyltransferase involved in cell wall biosynthesis
MTPYCHPSVDAYVFVSHYVRERFGFSACANEVIYPGSDFSLFAPRPHAFSDTIGMVYRLDESKLRKESVEVFIRVLQLRPTAKALIVGDGYLLAHFKEAVAKAGLTDRFTFTGYLAYEKLPEFYNQMDIFVAPVFCESFGQVTPFAMNMGIPVVAYETGALPEILNDPAVIAPAGDADALAKIIVELLASTERRAATASRQQARAAAHFSVEQMAAGYAKLYEEMLSAETSAQSGNQKAND